MVKSIYFGTVIISQFKIWFLFKWITNTFARVLKTKHYSLKSKLLISKVIFGFIFWKESCQWQDFFVFHPNRSKTIPEVLFFLFAYSGAKRPGINTTDVDRVRGVLRKSIFEGDHLYWNTFFWILSLKIMLLPAK